MRLSINRERELIKEEAVADLRAALVRRPGERGDSGVLLPPPTIRFDPHVRVVAADLLTEN
jgi:hypothetical protein